MSERITRRYRYRRVGVRDPESCVYCGNPAECLDHVLPLRYANWQPELTPAERRLLILVPACWECNALAGSTPFQTFRAKRAYVHDRLLRRYRKLLDLPSWTEAEVNELSGNLREHVRGEQARRRVALFRIGHHRYRAPDVEVWYS